MRTAPYIMALWQNGGPFVGDAGASHHRVTVEPDWYLHTDSSVSTLDPTYLPFRWYQRSDSSQVEVEVPNIVSIDTDTTMDADAAEATITMVNQKMKTNLGAQTGQRLGDPGHFTSDRGGISATARWGVKDPEWAGILVPGALLRTYQGWGGRSKTIGQALADGNLLQTGTWLIDDVEPTHDGRLSFKCRNMAKLLIEQILYPPLIPRYPLQWCRYIYTPYYHPAVPFYDQTHPVDYGPEGWGKAITDGAMDPEGDGYWLVGNDGGVFTFGKTAFWGSRGDIEEVDAAPMSCMSRTLNGRGYYLASEDGAVFSFGDATYYGGAPAVAPIRRIRVTPSGNGYWLVDNQGRVYAFGDADYHGGDPPTESPIVDMRPTVSGGGYWLLAADGTTYTYGDGVYLGNADMGTDVAVGFAVTPDGSGFWVASATGNVYTVGSAEQKTPNGDFAWAQANLMDPMVAIESTPSGLGYLLFAGDGGVFSFGDAPFYGSLPGPFQGMEVSDGNYRDFADIIKMLLLWSGFLLQGTGEDTVYGNIEATGTFSPECLQPDLFDKKAVIDAITTIKEIVGYIFFVDEEGAARFESPNWFSPGNFFETGSKSSFIPELDERQNLITYGVVESDKPARSELVITTDEPAAGNATTVTTRYTPPFANMLRGMVKPLMWVNSFLTSPEEQATAAELIAVHMFFAQRQSQAEAVANPALQINDQVWVFEEVTGEASIKHIRGISTHADLISGEYTMNLTLSHLGVFPDNWSIQ